MSRYTAVSGPPTRVILVSQPRKYSKADKSTSTGLTGNTAKLNRCRETSGPHLSPVPSQDRIAVGADRLLVSSPLIHTASRYTARSIDDGSGQFSNRREVHEPFESRSGICKARAIGRRVCWCVDATWMWLVRTSGGGTTLFLTATAWMEKWSGVR